jgi:hypothetical protein
MVDMNILGGFRQIGLTFHAVDNIVRVPFDKYAWENLLSSRTLEDQLPSRESVGSPAQYSFWIDQQKGVKQYPPIAFWFR